MGFRQALKTIGKQTGAPLKVPEIARSQRAADKITGSGVGADAPRSGRDYNVVARGLLAALSSGGSLTWREAREGAWCLWATSPALGEWRESLDAVLGAVATSEKKQPFRALASSWMMSFEPDRAGVSEAADLLRAKAPVMGPPWSTLHATHDLFHLSGGPDSVAATALAQKASPSEVLRRQGLGAFSSESGYAKACVAAVLRRLAEGGAGEPMKRLEIVRSLSLNARGELVFSEHGPLVANALLKPFGSSMPDKGTRDAYLGLLIGLFRDPRLHPGSWTRMREAEATIRRWLTEQTLRQFLDVVDEVALERMWKYRRAFWEAVYRTDLISEAWVVFDGSGAQVARRSFGKQIAFAEFDGGGAQAGQAVLLMRVGRGVVAEWSHNGRCIIWNDAEAPSAPKLNRMKYPVYDLRAPGSAINRPDAAIFAVSHMNAEGYGWQQRVAERIRHMTGVRIPESSYRVR